MLKLILQRNSFFRKPSHVCRSVVLVSSKDVGMGLASLLLMQVGLSALILILNLWLPRRDGWLTFYSFILCAHLLSVYYALHIVF